MQLVVVVVVVVLKKEPVVSRKLTENKIQY